ncbi:MAG: amidohydrolase family protein [Acidimicrobiia bacterium]|nr:amidohydrolase family protein [Acidimicrobiia bacterium]
MHDLVIRNGTIIDGSGAPRFVGDLAIDGSTITAVGDVRDQGVREIDATDLLVTPGFVDMHTHYDAQVTWDPYLTPSGWHGVTTVVMGNCGVGFAPAKADRREWLIAMMEGVEDIPGAALTDGIEWEWETFPEYLDALDRRRWVTDVATQVPHGALRAWVMGDRCADGIEATRSEVDAMAALTEEALSAGALGFSTSRTPLHRSIDGELVPGTSADAGELLGIADGMAAAGHGVFECALHHPEVPGSFEWLREVARRTGKPAVFNFNIPDTHPELYRDVLAKLDEAEADGIEVYGQVAGRPVGVLMSWDGTINPFMGRPTFEALRSLDAPARRTQLNKPELRRLLLAEASTDERSLVQYISTSFDRMWLFEDEADYEPEPELSLLRRAGGDTTRAAEMAYDHLNSADGTGIIYFPFMNYAAGSLEPLRELHQHPRTRMGLADGGAHCGTIVDGGMPTFMLSYWARDRSRGDTLPLELVVHRQTQQTAEFYGLEDRGVLAPGYRADVNVIDFDTLGFERPRMAWDLPTGAPRYVQRSTGYRFTLCAGVVTVEKGEFTGQLPGRLIRGPQSVS